jgi:hypothetical protein
MKQPDGLNILMSTPVMKENGVYGVCANGALWRLNAEAGKQL